MRTQIKGQDDQDLRGQLGRSFASLWVVNEDTPLRVPVPSAQRVVQIACGDEHTVMLLQNGTALAFGSKEAGQLGLGRHPLDSPEFALFQYSVGSRAVQEARDELARGGAAADAARGASAAAYMTADGDE